jgi:hypothetical protein
VRPAHRSTPIKNHWCVGRTLREIETWHFEIGSNLIDTIATVT